MGGSSPNSVLLVLDPRNNSAILEGARHSGLSAKGFTLLTEIVKANGRTLPGAELRKILHMQRVDRALKKNVPEQLRPVIDSSPGYEGGYRLRSLYIGRWSIKSP